jgi:hypothetical protein
VQLARMTMLISKAKSVCGGCMKGFFSSKKCDQCRQYDAVFCFACHCFNHHNSILQKRYHINKYQLIYQSGKMLAIGSIYFGIALSILGGITFW